MRRGIIAKLYFFALILSFFTDKGQIQDLEKWWALCYALVRRLTCRRSLCLQTSEKNSLRWISSAEKRHANSNPNRNSALWIQCLLCRSAWLAAYPVNNDELLKVLTKHQEADLFKRAKMNVCLNSPKFLFLIMSCFSWMVFRRNFRSEKIANLIFIQRR